MIARSRLRHRLRALRVRARQRGRVELRGTPRLGRGVRFEVAPGARVVVGDGAALGERCRVEVRGGTVAIGAGTVLGDRCAVVARAGVAIGERCVLGDEVVVVDFDHHFGDSETPIRLQGLRAAAVHIDAGAVLGPRVAVLRGVRIGAGARVGSHSVVTRDVVAGAVVDGVPAGGGHAIRRPPTIADRE